MVYRPHPCEWLTEGGSFCDWVATDDGWAQFATSTRGPFATEGTADPAPN